MIADAYLGAGDNAKAVAALKKVADLDPHPPTWNHIASLLAKHDVGLSDAEQFAERAVKVEEDRAAQTSLEKLEEGNVRCMPNLADYWDTLGWVYFRQGKVTQAEKYFGAAWNLAPRGSTGDHLGHLYEKQGKKQAAIDAYSAGLAGFVPEQEVREEMYSRLLALLKNQPTVGATLKLARLNFSRPHSSKLGKLSMKPGSAEFWLLLGPRGGVEDVKFISGVETFRSLTKNIAAQKFKVVLPGDGPIKLLRRGVLVCVGGDNGCDFTLQDPRTVHLDVHLVPQVK